MSGPVVSVVYHNNKFYLPPRYAGHPTDRLASTAGDNLAEFAGRLCYDSVTSIKGRPTPAYHDHILNTKHHSVYAHAVETFAVSVPHIQTRYETLLALQSRPGVWVTAFTDTGFRVAVSLRAIIEWASHQPVAEISSGFSFRDRIRVLGLGLGRRFLDEIRNYYPCALQSTDLDAGYVTALRQAGVTATKTAPVYPMEQWVSLYIEGVSRDLLQDWVRHHYQTNYSVRSTRYVDEGGSTQIVNPTTAEKGVDLGLHRTLADVFSKCKEGYKDVYGKLTEAGVDHKTARSAARNLLPGATETRLVSSMSWEQARHTLALRSNESTGAVDPEIRRLANLIREAISAEPVGWLL